MSIASEIERLQDAKSALKTAIEGKGVSVPASTKLDGYSALVDSIEQGGGGGFSKEDLGSISLFIRARETPTILDASNNFDGGHLYVGARALYGIIYNFKDTSITINPNWAQGYGSGCITLNKQTTLLEIGNDKFDYLWNSNNFTVYFYLNNELIGKVIVDDD